MEISPFTGKPSGHRDFAFDKAFNEWYILVFSQAIGLYPNQQKMDGPLFLGMDPLAHCTDKEVAATKVERQVTKSAAAMLLESRIGEQYDAIVTGASEKGTWLCLLHPPIEGGLESGIEGMDV